ncbi:hypothetical protein EOPP23_07865 [Endozoicomonas sp. OPT23]|uniref:DUF2608 domain-containing protein n=1 Tax=Endozoicomonas sp. OPT23 TaxID=2072845 RepID=UPI00129A2F8B|nr:DUF2608 domain-containing protein [Endozoicomonas sp. OPT23]MRI32899.1 hypothetical protein [Endozoicomonas sp. OPT23]
MNRIILLAGIAIMTMVQGLVAYGEILPQQETSKTGSFLKKATTQYPSPDELLVVLDLDDTTITSPKGQLLGRSDMFYHLLGKEQKAHPDKTKKEVAETIDPILEAVYRRVAVTATDDQLPDVLNNLKDRNIMVIGMTARGKAVSAVTQEQLKRANINFYDTGPLRIVELDSDRSIRIEHGVVMVSHGNSKGESLTALMRQGYLEHPTQVIMIDDRQKHLDDVAQALTKFDKSIRFSPVLCTFLKTTTPFNASDSEVEMIDFLFQWRKDPEIKRFIKNDVFTQKVIRECSEKSASGKACVALKKLINS